MKQLFYIAVLTLLMGFDSIAQQTKSDRIGFGVSRIALDLPDDLTFLPKLSYQHQFSNRLFASADLGYLRYETVEYWFVQVPRLRRRLTFDTAVKFSLLKYKNNHLRIAAGPSLWHRDDVVAKRIRFENGQATNYELERNKGWNVGYNVGLELDVNLTPKLSAMGNVQMANLGRSGLNSLLGVSIYYRVR